MADHTMARRRDSRIERANLRRVSMDPPAAVGDGRVYVPGYGVYIRRRESDSQIVIDDLDGAQGDVDRDQAIHTINDERVTPDMGLLEFARILMAHPEAELDVTIEEDVTEREILQEGAPVTQTTYSYETSRAEVEEDDTKLLEAEVARLKHTIEEVSLERDEMADERNQKVLLCEEALEQVEELQEETQELHEEIRRLRALLDQGDTDRSEDHAMTKARLEALLSELSGKEQIIFELKQQLSELSTKDRIIFDLKQQLSAGSVAEGDVLRLQESNREMTLELASYQQQYADLRAKSTELAAQLAVAEEKLNEQILSKSSAQEEIVRLNFAVNERDSQNASLLLQLEEAVKNSQPSELLLQELAALRADLIAVKEQRLSAHTELIHLCNDGQEVVDRNMAQIRALYEQLQAEEASREAAATKHSSEVEEYRTLIDKLQTQITTLQQSSSRELATTTRQIKQVKRISALETVYFPVSVRPTHSAPRYGLVGECVFQANRNEIAFLDPIGWGPLVSFPMTAVARYGVRGDNMFVDVAPNPRGPTSTFSFDVAQPNQLMSLMKGFVTA